MSRPLVVIEDRSGFDLGTVSGEGLAQVMAGVLEAAGVRVVAPEALSLRDQLELYHSADPLIFSEGSALHGLQLLGRGLGHVAVLCRRPKGVGLARASLAPRAGALSYHQVLRDIVALLNPQGQEVPALALTLLEPGALLASLREVGVPVDHLWDPAAFAEAELRDIEAWLARPRKPQHWDDPASRAHVAARLARHFGDRFPVR